MELPDLTNLTLTQVIGLTVLVTAIDVIAGVALAIVHGKFSLAFIAIWLQSHVVPRVTPILLLAALGNGIPAFDIPAIPPAFALSVAGLAAYILETIASVRDSFRPGDAPPPPDDTPVPAA